MTTGLYGYLRHPQYVGFIAIIVGFLVQWPTLVTVIMAPILIVRYILLANKEERKALEEYGDPYRNYMARIPAWIPKLGRGAKSNDE